MTLLLGIDTGGTYTDAVLFDEEKGVIASAKSLTTREDYAIGIGNSLAKVIAAEGITPGDIGLVSLSTTLATNALVEGQGGRICLVMIGFEESALDRNNLREALKGDPVIFLGGGHNGHGEALAPLDEDKLTAELAAMEGSVSAFAVAGLFAIRNPEHELRARELILAHSGNSVTCSHELSSKLDGPRRALTSVLNARLINLIHHLVASTEALLAQTRINAPLMVVQGDGALISAEIAKVKPIETILSGPAASLVGAAYLSGETDAMVSDIGGTTTDIALLDGGRPRLDAEGATVGGWRTMVEAVAMYTVGLGGDSEVSAVRSGLSLAIGLGPRRLVPVSLFALDHADLVHRTLDAALGQERVTETSGRFAAVIGRQSAHLAALKPLERDLLDELQKGPVALDKLIVKRRYLTALDRLVSMGLVMVAGLTPSDAAHVLRLHDAWDRGAAEMAAALFARNKDSRGMAIAPSADALSRMIVDALVTTSSETLIEAALAGNEQLPPSLAVSLYRAARRPEAHPLVDLSIGFRKPVIGLGASAHIYYPEVAGRLRTRAIIPDHAGVANAVGAVVGQVRVSANATIMPTETDEFRLYHSGEPLDFATLEAAALAAQELLTREAEEMATAAGAMQIHTTFDRKDNVALIDGRELFIESLLTVVAFGRPRIAR
ncbi:hydantoinase/oxoprolinase family protein [Sneathiella chungangensis]|uniref:Hydantoinase/oxoprolinase family protein n=1 Tax=Sneathiella chungangensis TaxID=1418234 RepID=A0A845MC99_9PROT|nr:hydantoinase/oxoprolinase family protein [Sneathiella chungangensis]MZR21271.1 hydantoinase/oxoprolinase family protein [Sneathiella chungangensis]